MSLMGLTLLAVAVVAATPGLSKGGNENASNDSSVADIDVMFHEDGMGFNVTSSKDLSNLIIEYCPGGEYEKIEFEQDGTTEYTVEGDELILGVWVKSGSFKDDAGPPGAGERFDNDVGCPGDGGDNGDPEAGCRSFLAIANEDGSITVMAEELNTTATVMRDGKVIVTLDAVNTTFTDTGLENGVAYTYSIMVDGELCDSVEVTAMPFFRTVLTGGIGVGVSLLGYLGVRRFM